MKDTLKKQERKFIETRTILISPEKHKFLTLMKIEGEFRNIDDVVDVLIQAYNKLRVMEKAEKLRQKNEQKIEQNENPKPN